MAKVTKRERFAEIKEVLMGEIARGEDVTALVDFVDREVELLEKRAGKERKPTATQVANEALKADIVEMLGEVGEGRTATEIANAFEGMTVQKAAQLLRQLVAAGEVTRVEGKGKTKTLFAV